jgi:ferredoxin
MGSGPRCEAPFDLALTEIDGGFVVRGGSPKGERLLAAIPSEPVTAAVIAKAEAVTARARTKMGRELDTSDLPALLLNNREHPRWQEVADICLACGNCTAVCPTCFCHDVTDGIDLTGTEAIRTREWASCFSVEFGHTAGGDVRTSGAARYRQWLSHKFGTWFEQFGTSGCVGCGRCITWCPAGIDVTEEIELIRAGGEAG